MSALNGSWIEIFKAGDYGQRGAWTADDLDRIAAAYNPRLHQAPVVLGHPATDAPAYGWVARLRRAGQSLWAQLEKVDPAFEQLLRAGRFRQRSVALYRNFPPTGGAYLRHLGFLGAQPPAVKGLAPVRFLNAPAFSFTEPLPAAAELLVAHDLPAGPDAPSVKAKPETPMSHSKLENFLNHLRAFFSPEASPTPTHGEESLPAGSAVDSSPPASLADESLAAEVAGESSDDESHGDSLSAVSSLVGHGFSERSGDPAQFAGSRASKEFARRPTTEGVRGKPSRVSPDSAPEQTELTAFAERVAQLEQRLGLLTVEKNTVQKKFAAAETAARQADVGLSLEKSTYTEAAIKLAANQPIRWSTDADLTFDGTRFDFNRSGNFTSASAGVVPLLARHAASPTVSYFSLERDDNALIFGVDQNGMVRMKPAFGTGLEIDPDSVPTIRAVGGNTNTALRLDSKGTQAVAVNANANSGTGGFEIFSGGATPALRLRLHADADQISFGSAADTNLYRSAADTLKTDDSFVVAGTLTLGSVTISTGTGAPSGGCTTGSLFLRTDGGSSTTLYVCESSSWVAK